MRLAEDLVRVLDDDLLHPPLKHLRGALQDPQEELVVLDAQALQALVELVELLVHGILLAARHPSLVRPRAGRNLSQELPAEARNAARSKLAGSRVAPNASSHSSGTGSRSIRSVEIAAIRGGEIRAAVVDHDPENPQARERARPRA